MYLLYFYDLNSTCNIVTSLKLPQGCNRVALQPLTKFRFDSWDGKKNKKLYLHQITPFTLKKKKSLKLGEKIK